MSPLTNKQDDLLPSGALVLTDIAKKRLLKSALVVFATRGFHRTTVSLIIQQAQVSRPTFYLHFENKIDLITQSLSAHWLELNAALIDASTNVQTLEAKSSARISVYFMWWCERAELGRRLFSEANDPSSPVFSVRENMISTITQYWADQLSLKNTAATIDSLEISALLSMIEQLCIKLLRLTDEERKAEQERFINCAATVTHSYFAHKKLVG